DPNGRLPGHRARARVSPVRAFPNPGSRDTLDPESGPRTDLTRDTGTVPGSIMSSSPNGRGGSHRGPMRRLRYDDLASLVVGSSVRGLRREGGYAALAAPWLPRSHSGRRFVITAALVVLVISGTLALAFRDWRARYRERAAFGASQVVPAIQPMDE